MSVSVCSPDGCSIIEAVPSFRGLWQWSRNCRHRLRERKMRLVTEKGYRDENEAISVTGNDLFHPASSVADIRAADPAANWSTTAPLGLGRSLAHVARRVGIWVDVCPVHRVHDYYLWSYLFSLSPIRLLRTPPLGTSAHDGPAFVGRTPFG